MNITHLLSVDMARRMPMVPVDAVQGDGNTRILKLTLLENGESWAVPEGVTGAVAFRKPDGTKGLYDTLPDGSKAVTMEGSTVSAVLAPQVLTCPGEVSATVVFHDGDLNQLAAFPVLIRVAANPAAGQVVSNDYYRYSTMAAVSDALSEMAPAILCEADGEVIAVADAADRPLKGLSICGKTIQNGTPTPSAPVALESVGESIGVTVCGKNLLPNTATTQTINNVTFTVNKDGSVNVNGTASANTSFYIRRDYVLPAGTFVLSGCPSGGLVSTYMLFIDPLNIVETGNGAKFTVPSDGNSCHIRIFIKQGATVPNLVFYPMISVSGGEYEPYKGQTLTATAEGGLHGIGEVKDEIDFARGVRVKQVEQIVLDGTEPVGLANSTSSQSWIIIDYNLPCALLRDKGYCSHFRYNQKLAGDGNANYCGMQTSYTAAGKARLWITTTMSASEFKAFCAQQHAAGTPVTVQYVLAEPIETPLTAEELAAFAALRTGKPNTTVFNDSGADMKLGYVADTKLYIDQKIAAISAAMLNA